MKSRREKLAVGNSTGMVVSFWRSPSLVKDDEESGGGADVIDHRGEDEKGFAFIMVLIFLLVGTMLITPLLTFMASGLSIGTVYLRNMDELYAADAGMKQAMLYIKDNGHLKAVPNISGDSFSYNLTPNPTLNGKTVTFNITCISANQLTRSMYKITSVAQTSSTSKTKIEAYVFALPFFWTNAATSNGTVDQQPGVSIVGPVVSSYPADKWPFLSTQSLKDYYWYQPSVSITALNWTSGPPPAGIYINSFTASNTIGPGSTNSSVSEYRLRNGGGAGLKVTQGGTIYLKGDLTIGATGQDFTYDLAGKTIFVEGDITIGGKASFTGSGCIIALGDINFQPNLSGNSSDFIFIMSLEGSVYFSPNGNFYGSVAGFDNVNFQPGNYFMLPAEPPTNLNFPMDDLTNLAVRVRTWNITRN